MKKFIPLNQLFVELRNKKLSTWLDKLNFSHIFIIWMSIVVTFGVMYHFLSTPSSLLIYTSNKEQVTNLVDKIYFSFITATTTGFGDIVPIGFFKVIAVFEVVIDLMMVALVTSKFISIKQDIILDEMYELSFYEQLNRLRSSLVLFRQNLGAIITDADDGTVRKSQLNELESYFYAFSDSLQDIIFLLERPDDSHFVKKVSLMDVEILLNSVLSSLNKTYEFIQTLNQKKIKWKSEENRKAMEKALIMVDLVGKAVKRNKVQKHIAKDFMFHYQKMIDQIRKKI